MSLLTRITDYMAKCYVKFTQTSLYGSESKLVLYGILVNTVRIEYEIWMCDMLFTLGNWSKICMNVHVKTTILCGNFNTISRPKLVNHMDNYYGELCNLTTVISTLWQQQLCDYYARTCSLAFY